MTLIGIIRGLAYEYDNLRIEPIGPKLAPMRWRLHNGATGSIEEFDNPKLLLSAWLQNAWGRGWQRYL